MRNAVSTGRYPLAFIPLLLLATQVGATDLQPLDDAALSDVRGRDGVSFGINLNANIGSVTVGVTDTDSNPATLSKNNVVITGTIASTLDLTAGTATTPSYINWAFPNLAGVNNLQYGYDLAITANGTTLGTGVQLQNFSFGGSSMQMTPYSGGGVTFGMALNLQVGNVLLQPNGRGNSVGQMNLGGISIGGTGAAGTPWTLADINAQPGIINVVTDSSGNPTLQWGIGWPTAPGTAPTGSVQISNITFTTPEGNVNLGSSSIGSMQIQYLNIKLKP